MTAKNQYNLNDQGLTPRQASIYKFIKGCIQDRGYGPTVREVGLKFNISSPNGVMCHFRALQKKGFIERKENQSRAITLVSTPETSTFNCKKVKVGNNVVEYVWGKGMIVTHLNTVDVSQYA